MTENTKFNNIFGINKQIIGMIHLSGQNKQEKIKRALEELAIYEKEKINGAIIEDYHGTIQNVQETLFQSQEKFNLIIGVNTLRNPYLGFRLAHTYKAKFVQFDSVQTPDLDIELYNKNRTEFPDISVFGGIRFKYTPTTGNSLEHDLQQGKQRAEAIVTTGQGTGIETPTNKLKEFKELLGNFPLIVGAGVNLKNVYEQLQICDSAIIGSYFKPNANTHLPIDKKRVSELMNLVKELRNQI
jgi:hypothetical protein